MRTFRISRGANLSPRLEPALWKLARLIPPTTGEVTANLPLGATLLMPPGYRDTRTVAAGIFQADESRLFERLAKPGMTILDIGAYVGYFTLLASRLAGPSGRVYAFEPERTAYAYLVKNVAINVCRNVVAINKAVSDTGNSAALMRDPLGPESYLGNGWGAGVQIVETVALDAFMHGTQLPDVDLIKMNIEGAELLALQGMREVSKRNPQLMLIMEYNPTAMARAGATRDALMATLAELGFRHGQVVERQMRVVASGDLLPKGRGVYNILLTK